MVNAKREEELTARAREGEEILTDDPGLRQVWR